MNKSLWMFLCAAVVATLVVPLAQAASNCQNQATIACPECYGNLGWVKGMVMASNHAQLTFENKLMRFSLSNFYMPYANDTSSTSKPHTEIYAEWENGWLSGEFTASKKPCAGIWMGNSGGGNTHLFSGIYFAFGGGFFDAQQNTEGKMYHLWVVRFEPGIGLRLGNKLSLFTSAFSMGSLYFYEFPEPVPIYESFNPEPVRYNWKKSFDFEGNFKGYHVRVGLLYRLFAISADWRYLSSTQFKSKVWSVVIGLKVDEW